MRDKKPNRSTSFTFNSLKWTQSMRTIKLYCAKIDESYDMKKNVGVSVFQRSHFIIITTFKDRIFLAVFTLPDKR